MAPAGEGVGWPRPIPVDEHQGMPPAWHEPVTSRRGRLGVGSLGVDRAATQGDVEF